MEECKLKIIEKFGEKDHWGDFELVSRKIDELVTRGLMKLQRLTMEKGIFDHKSGNFVTEE